MRLHANQPSLWTSPKKGETKKKKKRGVRSAWNEVSLAIGDCNDNACVRRPHPSHTCRATRGPSATNTRATPAFLLCSVGSTGCRQLRRALCILERSEPLRTVADKPLAELAADLVCRVSGGRSRGREALLRGPGLAHRGLQPPHHLRGRRATARKSQASKANRAPEWTGGGGAAVSGARLTIEEAARGPPVRS